MAIRATGGFNLVRYEPGNPEFPTLPDGVIVPHFIDLSRVAGFRAPVVTKPQVFASAPANDRQRFAGWQTDTTWINPAVIDFGVITSPVRLTVSLYNARFTSVDVTAVSFGSTGVTLISPALPQTLDPYGGVTFTIEAGTTGPDSFDEFAEFTTSEGVMRFRIIGRRVFSINIVPQRPIIESLRFKTDLIRSDDGSEKAYSLLRTPSSRVDYLVRQTDDLQRIKLRNDFIAGESALIVGAQKWWERVNTVFEIQSTDLSVAVPYPALSSWTVGGPISVVSQDGLTVAQATVDTITVGPDPYIESVVILANFDGPDGSTDATNLIDGTAWTMLFGTQIDTAQSQFGGASLLCSTINPGFNAGGAQLPYNPNMDAPTDMTLDMWFRPTATDLASNNTLASRWYSLDPGARAWRLDILSNGASLRWEQREGGNTRAYDFPTGGLVADTWYYLRVSKIDGTIRMGLNGAEIGSGLAQVAASNEGNIRFIVGDYYDSGFTKDFKGHIDEVRFTAGVGRDVNEAAPIAPHPGPDDTYTLLNFSTEIGTAFDTEASVIPVGLGYISKFPQWGTFPVNAEDISFQVMLNQEPDFAELPAEFPLLDGIPILEFCNEIEGAAKQSQLVRNEEVLDSGLSNRIAFNKYPFSDITSDFKIELQTRYDIWMWRRFLHYMGGSWNEMYVPTFRQDFPGVTTLASNVFDVADMNYATLFGTTTPPKRRDALRFEYDDGTIQYRTITAVVDNGATEQFTVSSAVNAGNPKISFMNLSRILGDSATFRHISTNDSVLKFKYRTIQR